MPKLRPENLAASLNNKIAPVYLVSGDETLLVQEACDTLRQTARRAGYTERELYHSETNFDWHYLRQNLNSLSLFSDKKIIEVRVGNGKINDDASEVLQDYCAQAPDDTLLLLVFPKLDKRTQNADWYKAIEHCGFTLTIWPVGPENLPRWLDQRLQSAGIRADSAAIDILCTKIEGNLLAAAQEIEKLKLLANKGTIDSETMANVVMDSARYSVFTLIDRALNADSRATIRTLQGLQGEGIAPLTILWALGREVKILIALRESIDAGDSFDLAAKKNGVWDSKKQVLASATRRLKLPQLHQILRLIALTDRTVKGMAQGDEWNLLQDVCLNLSGLQTLSKPTQKLVLSF